MSEQDGTGSLLETLRNLYRQVANRMLLVRQKSYRPGASGAGSTELARQLRDYIKRAHGSDSARRHDTTRAEAGPVATHLHVSGNDVAEAKPADIGPGLMEMHYEHRSEEPLGNKLMQSAWEHLHASMRAARMGDRETARLHASIMESSLKEAARFLDDEQYRNFVHGLGKVLDEQARLMENQPKQ